MEGAITSRTQCNNKLNFRFISLLGKIPDDMANDEKKTSKKNSLHMLVAKKLSTLAFYSRTILIGNGIGSKKGYNFSIASKSCLV